ncbi:hypothetical protein BJX96DRAFT_138515 [Aspergillus floccosus]
MLELGCCCFFSPLVIRSALLAYSPSRCIVLPAKREIHPSIYLFCTGEDERRLRVRDLAIDHTYLPTCLPSDFAPGLCFVMIAACPYRKFWRRRVRE